MKEKDFDQLIAAAFGELRADEQAKFEAGLDAEGKAELAEFKKLSASLGAMPTPGPCQVSPEMLRDRILGEGVRSRPAFLSWLPRVAVTGIAAALGFFVLNSLDRTTEPTAPVTKPTQVAVSTVPNQGTVLEAGPNLDPGINRIERPRSDGEVESVRIVEAAPVVQKPRSERVRVSKRPKAAMKKVSPVINLDGMKLSAGSGVAKAVVPPNAPGANPEVIGADAAMAENVVSTVVIVTSEEGEVGAPVATEVSTANELGIKG